MSNKIEIVYDFDRSEVLHDAIVGHSIVEVLADGVPVAEANNTYGVRNVTLVMDNGTEIEFSSNVRWWHGPMDEKDMAMIVDALDAEYFMGKQIIAAWVDSFIGNDEDYPEEPIFAHKTFRVIVDGFHCPVNILETRDEDGENGPIMFVEIRQEEK